MRLTRNQTLLNEVPLRQPYEYIVWNSNNFQQGSGMTIFARVTEAIMELPVGRYLYRINIGPGAKHPHYLTQNKKGICYSGHALALKVIVRPNMYKMTVGGVNAEMEGDWDYVKAFQENFPAPFTFKVFQTRDEIQGHDCVVFFMDNISPRQLMNSVD